MAAHFGDVLVIAAEKMSAVIESAALDPNTAILFGDGAGAALVSARPGPWEVLDTVLHSDGQYRDSLAFDWSSPLRMNGLSVILQAARKLPSSIGEVLTRQKLAAADVSVFLLHQANQNLLIRVAKSLEFPQSASIPTLLATGTRRRRRCSLPRLNGRRRIQWPGPWCFPPLGRDSTGARCWRAPFSLQRPLRAVRECWIAPPYWSRAAEIRRCRRRSTSRRRTR